MEGRMLLLVEDNPDDVVLARRALKCSGINADMHVACDGVEARDYLFGVGAYAGRDINEQPDLILLDLNIPRLSGLEVLQQIRENPVTKYLPVIMLSTSREQRDMVASYDLGANSYLRKPVDFEHFSALMKQLCLYWLEFNEIPREE